MEKTSKVISGAKEITKSFPIRLGVDASSRLIKCHSSTENAVSTAKKEACENIGGAGAYDETSDTCDLSSFITNQLDTRYLRKDITTLQNGAGSIQVNGNITATNQLCTGSNCRTFNRYECANNEVMKGINPD